jgi:GMP synthase-like glutamine amidotransferase
MARCLVVQHLEPEGPYLIADALDAAGVAIDTCAVFAGDVVPGDLTDYDALVVMGGPMSAADDEGFPTRRSELRLLREAVEDGVPTLGVCLGAQLLAAAGGGRVYPGTAGAEIGWMPVSLEGAASGDELFRGMASPVPVLHWHGDTFDLPPGATHLARSARYPNQAFRIGRRAWGLQFHLEIDEHAVEVFAETFAADASAAGLSPESIVASTEGALRQLTPVRDEVLARFAGLVRSRRAGIHGRRTSSDGVPPGRRA